MDQATWLYPREDTLRDAVPPCTMFALALLFNCVTPRIARLAEVIDDFDEILLKKRCVFWRDLGL